MVFNFLKNMFRRRNHRNSYASTGFQFTPGPDNNLVRKFDAASRQADSLNYSYLTNLLLSNNPLKNPDFAKQLYSQLGISFDEADLQYSLGTLKIGVAIKANNIREPTQENLEQRRRLLTLESLINARLAYESSGESNFLDYLRRETAKDYEVIHPSSGDYNTYVTRFGVFHSHALDIKQYLPVAIREKQENYEPNTETAPILAIA